MTSTPARVLGAAAVAAAGGRLGWVARSLLPGGERWERSNHAGDPVTMREGPAWVLGASAALAFTPGLTGRQRAAALTATSAAAVFGAIDDLAETGRSKGLRGHLGALRRGEVTTGALKILGISAGGLIAAALLEPTARGRAQRLTSVLTGGGVVAGTANLLNLLDLRPGRALKVVLLHSVTMLTGGPAALTQGAAAGASVALLGPDLGERSMLGDCGANAVGALLGVTLLLATDGSRNPLLLRSVALAGLVGLTVASERVSFTRVIEATPGLRELDALGRRPRPE